MLWSLSCPLLHSWGAAAILSSVNIIRLEGLELCMRNLAGAECDGLHMKNDFVFCGMSYRLKGDCEKRSSRPHSTVKIAQPCEEILNGCLNKDVTTGTMTVFGPPQQDLIYRLKIPSVYVDLPNLRAAEHSPNTIPPSILLTPLKPDLYSPPA